METTEVTDDTTHNLVKN